MTGDESLSDSPSYETLQAARACNDEMLRDAIRLVLDRRVADSARAINAALTGVAAGDAIRNFLQGYPTQPCALRQGTEALRGAAGRVIAACDAMDEELRDSERILALLNPREEAADA